MNSCPLISKVFTFPNNSNIFISGLDVYYSNDNIFFKNNIKTVISILEENVPDLNKFGIIHKKYNIPDISNSNILSIIEQTYPIILSSISKGYNILVHCRAGMSRSVSIVIGFLLLCLKNHKELIRIPKTHSTWTETFLEYIRLNRKCASPNGGFIEQLLYLENYILYTFK